MTLSEVEDRLRTARLRLGGRFALTLSEGEGPAVYLTHWTRPEAHAFEQCRAVGVGTLAQCLAALDRYVSSRSASSSSRSSAARAEGSSTGRSSAASSTKAEGSPSVRRA